MWINLSPNLNPNLNPNPSRNLMSSLLNTCLLPLFSISSRIKLVMIFLFLLVMNILFLVTNILSRIYSSQNIFFLEHSFCQEYSLRKIFSSSNIPFGKNIFFSQYFNIFYTNILLLLHSLSLCVLRRSATDKNILLSF